MENKVRKTKSPAKVLRVTVNGVCVQKFNSTETFLACLKVFGPEKVASLSDVRVGGLPLVVSFKDNRLQMRQLERDWFACTHMSTIDKKKLLERIAEKLNLSIKIEIL